MKLYEQTQFTGPSNVRYWVVWKGGLMAALWDGTFELDPSWSDDGPEFLTDTMWQLLGEWI